jgi:hypothetical protein
VDVRPVSEPGAQPERWAVVLEGPSGPVALDVASRPGPLAGRLTCRAVHPAHPRTWDVRLVAAV